MSKLKGVAVVLATAALTTVLLLGLAQLPGGGGVGEKLHSMAEQAFHEPFEVTLQRELDELYYQQHRALMTHLVMLQVAEHARRARLHAISRADLRDWQIPLSRIAAAGDTRANVRHAVASFGAPTSTPALETDKRANGPLVFTLVCFILAAAWGFSRRDY